MRWKKTAEKQLNQIKHCLPNAWHCRIFVRPSLTIEPADDGCVVNRGGCNCCDISAME